MNCYHCGLTVPKGVDLPVVIDGQAQPMCCPGCQAVATAIADGGLENFYRYRSKLSTRPDEQATGQFSAYDLAEVSADYVQTITSQDQTGQTLVKHSATLIVTGITCAACAWLLEHHLCSLAGVDEITVNVSSNRATVIWQPQQIKFSAILKAFSDIGYQARPIGDEGLAQLRQRENRRYLLKLGVAGIGMMQTGMLAIALYAGAFEGMDSTIENFLRWVSLLFVTPVIFYSGQDFFANAWRNLRYLSRQNFRLGMNIPVSLALLLAYAASVWATVAGEGEIYFDAVAMFVFFLLIGRYLEMRVRHRNEILGEGIAGGLPVVATRLQAGEAQQVAVKSLQPGDSIRVAAGAVLPCDGQVIEGAGTVSEALLTGEQHPIAKQPGSEVSAGAINGENPLTILVTAVGQRTRLSAIMKLVDRAQHDKPLQVAMADKLSGYFVLTLLLIACSTAIWWWQHAPDEALWVVVAVLVVACPCALSLATPATLAVASAQLRKHGFLVTRGHVLETLADITHVVFDKTGTLTESNMVVRSVLSVSSYTQPQLLALAAALEVDSKHPIAKAFSDIEVTQSASNLRQHLASGITGEINGNKYGIGRPEFIAGQFGFDDKTIQAVMRHSEYTQPGETCLLLCDQYQPLGWIVLQDKLRSGAIRTVKALSQDMDVQLLSGDREQAVSTVAQTLNITDWQAAVTPQQKLQTIQRLQQAGHKVLMVGDGINDIPVLSGADVSVAIGDATDLTRVHADSILLAGDLSALEQALKIARRTRHIIRQNLAWSACYNLCAVGLAVMGWIAPWAAAIGMSVSSLLVVLNAMRLAKSPRNKKQLGKLPSLREQPAG